MKKTPATTEVTTSACQHSSVKFTAPGRLPVRLGTVVAEVLARLLNHESLTGMEAVFGASTTRLAADGRGSPIAGRAWILAGVVSVLRCWVTTCDQTVTSPRPCFAPAARPGTHGRCGLKTVWQSVATSALLLPVELGFATIATGFRNNRNTQAAGFRRFRRRVSAQSARGFYASYAPRPARVSPKGSRVCPKVRDWFPRKVRTLASRWNGED